MTDAIAVLQCGLAVLSPVTVRFRKQDHAKLIALTKHAERLAICNDSEETGVGEAGAVETAKALFDAGRDVRIAVIPRPEGTDKIDVNELVAAGGAEALRQVIDSARRYPEYLLDKIPRDTPKQDLDRKLRPVLEAVARLTPIQQHDYREAMAKRFDIGVGPIRDRLREIVKEQQRSDAQARADRSERPSIFVGGRQLRSVIAEAGAVLCEANKVLITQVADASIPSSDAAPVFVRGGRLVRIDLSKGTPAVAELGEIEIYGLLARMADWFVDGQEGPSPTNPSALVSRDMLVYPPVGLPPAIPGPIECWESHA